MNLLEETIEKIEDAGLSIANIDFIGSADGEYQATWKQFATIADVWYDSGFGIGEVAQDLIIHFTDGTVLKRSEYDGSEWWDVHRPFKPRSNPKPLRVVISPPGKYLSQLADMNTEDGYTQ